MGTATERHGLAGYRHELSPPTFLSTAVARFSKAVANSNLKGQADGHRPDATEPPLPLTLERLELIKAFAKDPLRNAEGLPASRIAQRLTGSRFVDHSPAADAPLMAPLSALTSGIRTLTAVLIIFALLPNLTLAAFWLGLVELPSSAYRAPPKTHPMPQIQSAALSPVLSTPSTLEATAGEPVSFPIALDGTDGLTPRSLIVIRGLPQGSQLSSGYRQGATEWVLNPDEIGDLHLVLPAFAVGRSKLTIQLIAPGDRIVADVSTMLRLIPDQKPANAGWSGTEIAPAKPQVSATGAEEGDAASAEETGATAVASATPEVVPLPTRRPEPPGSDDADANWIKPSAYVNLRHAPSSSSAIVSVVAKGAKLRVLGRKRGWVQVSNPATSHKGWIYAGNVSYAR